MSTTRLSSRRQFLATSTAITTAAIMHPFALSAQSGQAHLRILATTDLHVHALPYDYYADRENETVGLSRTASLINGMRAEATNSILVDNGDYLQGNPMGDYVAYEHGMTDGYIHPIIKAMNTLGYDCGTLGNHEFNYGIEFLDRVNAGAEFPVICSNFVKKRATRERHGEFYAKPYVILQREIIDGAGEPHTLNIGLIGFVPPQIMQWDQQHLEEDYDARDIVESAQRFVPEMKEQGADIIVALSHSGLSNEPQTPLMENASAYLAGVDGIDAIVTGHSHLVFPSEGFEGGALIDAETGKVQGKPAVMAGYWGSHMGLIDLMLEYDGKKWHVADSTSEARPIYERRDGEVVALVDNAEPVAASVATAHQETLDYIRKPVGETASPLFSYFALVADDPSVEIVSQAQRWYIRDMMSKTEYKDLPVLSAAAPFKSGGRGGPDYYTDVPAGPIAIKNVADLYLYPNTVRAVKVTGAEVKDWLERSAGIFNQIESGADDAPLINPEFPSFNFDVIDGVTYEIDLSEPSKFDSDGNVVNPDANRIKRLSFDGRPIGMDAEFIIATNNYRAGGGGNFVGATPENTVFVAPDTNRDVIVRYIVERGTVDPQANRNWRFIDMGDTTATFETGPNARDYLDRVDLELTDLGDTAAGFARFRLAL